jgi:thioesterase domain-containing protein
MLHTFVGDDDAEVRELVRQPMKEYLRSSLKLVLDIAGSFPAFKRPRGGAEKWQDVDLHSLPDSDIEAMLDFAFERYFETSGLFGTPTTCARMVERCKRAGVDEIACLLDFGVSTQRVLASLPYLNEVRERANANTTSECPQSEAGFSVAANIQQSTTQPSVSDSAPSPIGRPAANTQVYTFLAMLRDRGIHVSADSDRLRCSAPPGAITPELRDDLQRRKKDILHVLRSASALAHQQRAIVPLQSRGRRTPVFAVAGHNGDVFCYRALARHLGDDQPFFGLQPPGLDGQGEPLTSVEDLAAYFAAQIRAFRPNGPYVIAGYCAGGTIAFELARQLLGDGASVDLVLFGSPFPTWYRRVPQLCHRLTNQAQWLARHAQAMATLPSGERRLYLAEKLRNRRAHSAAESAAVPDPVVVQREKVAQATLAALRHYVPRHFDRRVSLFFPSKESLKFRPLLQWRSIAEYTVEYFGPDGCTGNSMLREPYAPAFADLFKQCCASISPPGGEKRSETSANPCSSQVEMASGY